MYPFLELFAFLCLLRVGVVDGSNNGAVSWGNGRSLLQDNNGGDSSLILAAERTHRKDPSDKLNYYTGGWNISNDHYKSVSIPFEI